MRYAQFNPSGIVMNVVDLTAEEAATFPAGRLRALRDGETANPGDRHNGSVFAPDPQWAAAKAASDAAYAERAAIVVELEGEREAEIQRRLSTRTRDTVTR